MSGIGQISGHGNKVFWFSGLSEEKIGVGGWFLFLFFILHVISYHGNTKSEDPYNNTMTKVSEIL